MNELIKELALESKLRAVLLLKHWGTVDALTDSEQEELEQIEKFAELIVKECARVCDTLEEAYGAPSTTGKFIKHYFGVENERVNDSQGV